MASRVEVYGPPKVPTTPSKTINNMLKERCGKSHTNPAKAAISFAICYMFQAITRVYNMIHSKGTQTSHSMWMTSCGIVSAGIVLVAVLMYNIVMMSAFVVHNLLYFSTWGVSLFAIGLGVSGMVFFDKEGESNIQDVYRETKTTITRTAESVSDRFKEN